MEDELFSVLHRYLSGFRVHFFYRINDMSGALFIYDEFIAEADVIACRLKLSRSKRFQRNVASLYRSSTIVLKAPNRIPMPAASTMIRSSVGVGSASHANTPTIIMTGMVIL